MNIDLANTHVPDGMASDLRAEAARYEQLIREAGGIDVQLWASAKRAILALTNRCRR